MNRKIAAHFALIEGRLERNIIVEVDASRRIVSVTKVENIDRCASVEFFPGILIPGMVNAHCHLELSYLRGAIEEHTGFAGFASAIGRVRGNYTTEERIRAAKSADAQMWDEGVEAIMDIANDELIMPIKEASKIHYTTLFELFGLRCNSIDNHLAMSQQYANSSITPHSTYSLQDEVFKAACKANNSTVSLHLLESDDESDLYNERGSLAEWYKAMSWECDFLGYGSPAERVARSMDGSQRVLLVHGCKATPKDVTLLNNHFGHNATWVLCPESNRYISDIKPPVAMLREMDAPIAIGSDSLASTRSLSLIDNLRLIENTPLEELLSWATIGGAKALGLDGEMGSIEVGKRPGLVIIENVDLHNMRLIEESQSHRII